jgi:hypothetical protein
MDRNRNLPAKCLAVAFVLLSVAQVDARITGNPSAHARIAGTVVDQQGQPLKNIFVHAVSDETGMYMPTVDSNEAGDFVIEDLEPGTYDLFGESDVDAYPNTALPFYSDENPIKVTVRDFDTPTIVLVLGPRAGVLCGELLDKTTGRAIVSQHASQFGFRKVSNREDSIEFLGPGEFRWLVPPATDLTLEVFAEGYKPWVYADPSNLSRPVPFRLEAGEVRFLNIQLEPELQRENPPQ